MLRHFHRWPGLLAAALILALALSGAALSLFPAMEWLASPGQVPGQTVADLAARVLATHPGVEQIRRSPSGRITAYWFVADQAGAAVVDPATGQDIASADQGAIQIWLTDFHRALLLDDTGRYATATGALAMLVLLQPLLEELLFRGLIQGRLLARSWRRRLLAAGRRGVLLMTRLIRLSFGLVLVRIGGGKCIGGVAHSIGDDPGKEGHFDD